jgi:4-amino-4-deoxy-L-arabinose transferase-like glycosyltransferase
LTALLLAASVPLVYALGLRWFEDRRAAAAAALCVVLLPSLWVNAKGILSEPLFCLLLLATFCAIDASEKEPNGIWLLVLLAAIALTRTAARP